MNEWKKKRLTFLLIFISSPLEKENGGRARILWHLFHKSRHNDNDNDNDDDDDDNDDNNDDDDDDDDFFFTVKILLRNITFHHYIASLLDMLQSLLTVSTYNIFTTMFLPIDLCYSREGPIFT